MITIRRLSECPLRDAVSAWNKGFEDYYVKIMMTEDLFIKRMAAEGLSSSLSVVAYVNGEPAGLIVSGIRDAHDGRRAWNGGTAVAIPYRRQGVGKAMLQETLRIYREENVHAAYLEAISGNEKAIRLYESFGYSVTDRLLVMERKGPAIPASNSVPNEAGAYRLTSGRPQEAVQFEGYNKDAAWQAQWQSCKEGEALFALDDSGRIAGFALLRKNFDDAAKPVGTTLLQCAAAPRLPHPAPVVGAILSFIFDRPQAADLQQRAFNLSESTDQEVIRQLHHMGFENKSEQVHMRAALALQP